MERVLQFGSKGMHFAALDLKTDLTINYEIIATINTSGDIIIEVVCTKKMTAEQ